MGAAPEGRGSGELLSCREKPVQCLPALEDPTLNEDVWAVSASSAVPERSAEPKSSSTFQGLKFSQRGYWFQCNRPPWLNI